MGEQTKQRKQSKQSNPNKGKHNEQTKYNIQNMYLKYSKTRAWLLLMEKILVHSIFLCFIQSCSTGASGQGQEYWKYQLCIVQDFNWAGRQPPRTPPKNVYPENKN